MGGSSLAPEVFRALVRRRRTAGCACTSWTRPTPTRCAPSRPRSTSPRRCSWSRRSPAGRSRRCRSSSTSGRSGRDGAQLRRDHRPGLRRWQKLAAERGFRRVFLNDPDIGGRYSALSYFGLVPAALHGRRRRGAARRRRRRRAGAARRTTRRANTGLWLGCALGELALARPRQADVRRRRRRSRASACGPSSSSPSRRASRARASCRSPTSRSARRRPTATTASSCTCATPSDRRRGRRRRRRRRSPPPASRSSRSRRTGAADLGRDLVLRRVRDRGRGLGAGDQPVRPAQRAGGQGQRPSAVLDHRTGAARSAEAGDDALRALLGEPAPPSYVAILGYLAAVAPSSTPRSPSCARRSATATQATRRSATARATCTRPASSTRAARRRAASCSSSTTADARRRRSRAPATRFETLKRAQADGDLRRRCATTACRRERIALARRPRGGAARPHGDASRRPLMQIGFVGLGKMGGNMVAPHPARLRPRGRRLRLRRRGGRRTAEENGAAGAASLEELVKKLERAAHGLDHGARPATRPSRRSTSSPSCWTAATRSSTAATRSGPTTRRRAEALRQAGIHYVDVGTSGGVWGLEVGYCMMVGGPDEAVERLAPFLDVLAPPTSSEDASAPRLGPHGPDRRRALREDGPQRRSSTG